MLNLPFNRLEFDDLRYIIIDGDILAYRASALSEGLNSPSLSYDVVAGMMGRFIEEIGTTEYLIMLSGKDNFRKYLYPTYKSNRTALKPVHYDNVRNYISTRYACEIYNWVEADDAIVSLAVHVGSTSEITPVIVTLDKDLRQVPNTIFYNMVTGAMEHITTEAAYNSLFLQCLTGDTVDCVAGLRGIGKKKASKLADGLVFTSLDEVYSKVVDVYKSLGYTEKDAQVVYNCIVMQTNLPLLEIKGVDVPELTCNNIQEHILQRGLDAYIYGGRIPNLPV